MKKRNFSLIEIMIVLSIIALVAVIVVPNLGTTSDEAKVQAAQIKIQQLSGDIQNYKLKTGKLPGSFEDLVNDPGVKGWKQILEVVPVDPWENPYQFEETPGSFRGFEILSYGADGQPGGEGFNADITLSKRTRCFLVAVESYFLLSKF